MLNVMLKRSQDSLLWFESISAISTMYFYLYLNWDKKENSFAKLQKNLDRFCAFQVNYSKIDQPARWLSSMIHWLAIIENCHIYLGPKIHENHEASKWKLIKLLGKGKTFISNENSRMQKIQTLRL